MSNLQIVLGGALLCVFIVAFGTWYIRDMLSGYDQHGNPIEYSEEQDND